MAIAKALNADEATTLALVRKLGAARQEIDALTCRHFPSAVACGRAAGRLVPPTKK